MATCKASRLLLSFACSALRDAQLRNESKLCHRRLELRWYGMRLFSRASAEPVDLSSEVKVALNAAVASRVGVEAATQAAKQRAPQSCGLRTSSEEAWYSLGGLESVRVSV